MPEKLDQYNATDILIPVAYFTKEDNSRLAKHPLVFNGRLANRELTSLVKEATGVTGSWDTFILSVVLNFIRFFLGKTVSGR